MMHGWLLDGIDIGHYRPLIWLTYSTMEPQFEEGCVPSRRTAFPDYEAPANFSTSDFQAAVCGLPVIPDNKFDRTLTRRRSFWKLGSGFAGQSAGDADNPLATASRLINGYREPMVPGPFRCRPAGRAEHGGFRRGRRCVCPRHVEF